MHVVLCAHGCAQSRMRAAAFLHVAIPVGGEPEAPTRHPLGRIPTHQRKMMHGRLKQAVQQCKQPNAAAFVRARRRCKRDSLLGGQGHVLWGASCLSKLSTSRRFLPLLSKYLLFLFVTIPFKTIWSRFYHSALPIPAPLKIPAPFKGAGIPAPFCTLFVKRVRGGPFFEKISTGMVRGATERRP